VPARASKELPPPLPPGERTVGQLVAESIRFYGSHFWRSLALGIPAAIAALAVAELAGSARLIFALTGGAVLLTVSYVAAIALVAPEPIPPQRLMLALAIGLLVYLPAPVLASVFILPALAWFAFTGLAVPAAVLEGTGLRASFQRGRKLARADFIHVLGSLATLAIIAFLADGVLFFLLRGAGEATIRAAAFLAQLVISPVLFIGAALLYFDQAAREVRSASPPGRSRDAQVPDDDEPDLAGRADAQGQPRPAAGGQS
jgi:hypothetical protein